MLGRPSHYKLALTLTSYGLDTNIRDTTPTEGSIWDRPLGARIVLWNELLALLLGWLLGLLSPLISDAIKHRRDVKQGRLAILSELDELAIVLTMAGYRSCQAAGLFNRENLEWVREIVGSSEDRHKAFVETIDEMLEYSDDQLAALAAYSEASDQTSPMLQCYPAPLLDSRVAALWTFETEFQRKLLAIRRNLNLLDETVVQLRQYFRMTFEAQSQGNRSRIDSNIRQLYENYFERVKIVVNQIAELRGTEV